MPNRKYMGKGQRADNEFIYVDLLPDVRRPRQFNVNIILIVLIAVITSWAVIYIPLNARQQSLDDALALNNDLQNRILLVNEEIHGYRIDQERIDFYNNIERAEALQIDYTLYMSDLNMRVNDYNGQVLNVTYSAIENRIVLRVSLSNEFNFNNLRIDLLDVSFVNQVGLSSVQPLAGTSRYVAEFMIEVSRDVE